MVKFLIQRPVAVLMAFLALVIIGVITYFTLPVSLLPDIPIPEITVQASMLGNTAREMENTVVKPLRNQLMQVTKLRDIHSTTRDGSAQVNLRFDYGTNTDLAFIEVNEKIDAAMNSMPQDIGAPSVANKVLNSELKKLNEQLPMGYTAKNAGNSDWWNHENNAKQYIFLSLIILIIFFITAILFNSLKQPLAIIFVIPISYIGVFLTFYLFELNFDQGGFASFVLLCGITVNASIYLLDEYNNIRQRKPLISPINAYIKAWNIKIIPIFLTVISTILGFLPFMFGLDKESFWFPLSAGTIGGLVMSLVGIFIFLPIFVIGRKTLMKLRHKKLKLSK